MVPLRGFSVKFSFILRVMFTITITIIRRLLLRTLVLFYAVSKGNDVLRCLWNIIIVRDSIAQIFAKLREVVQSALLLGVL